MDDFEQKTVNTPILDSETKDKIFPEIAEQQTSRFGSFYRANKFYIWAIAGALLIVSVLAYFAFRDQPVSPNKEAKVNLSLDLPDTLPSSGDFIFRVKAENQDSAKLVNINLEIIYPDGVTYVSSSPAAKGESGTQFPVPDLSSGQNAVLTIKANMQGGINDNKQLQAVLRYNYDNFNSTFEKKAVASTRLIASDIVLEVTGPDKATTSEPANYEIKYSNSSDHTIQNARIKLTYPNNFTYGQSQPTPDLAKNIWNISSLEPGENGTIKVTGNFTSANPGESKTLLAEFLVLDSSGDFFTQATAEFTSQISGLPLFVSQTLEQNNSGTANPGDTLSYKVSYRNNGQTPVRGVNIVATLDSKALDSKNIHAEDGQVSGATITWNASTVNGLETINPNQGGELHYTVTLKNPAVKDSSKNITITSSIKITASEYDNYLPGNSIETKISSPADLSASISHVSGSLPPRVGQDTVYKVTLSLRNSTNDFTGTQVVAYLPLDPSSFDAQSVIRKEANNVTFDKTTGKITWNAGSLPAHSGDFNPAKTLEFNIRLRPTSAQVGRSVTLLRNMSASAKDGFTGRNVSMSTEDIGTQDLPNDGNNDVGQVKE